MVKCYYIINIGCYSYNKSFQCGYFKLNINVKNYKQIFDNDKYKIEYLVKEINTANPENEIIENNEEDEKDEKQIIIIMIYIKIMKNTAEKCKNRC